MQLDIFTRTPEELALDPKADLRTIPPDYRPLVRELREAREAEERARTLAAKRQAQAAAIIAELNTLTAPIPAAAWSTLAAEGYDYLELLDAPGAWSGAVDWPAVFRRLMSLTLISPEHFPEATGHVPTGPAALDRLLQLTTAHLHQS